MRHHRAGKVANGTEGRGAAGAVASGSPTPSTAQRRLSRTVSWLIDHGVTDDAAWIAHDYESFLEHNLENGRRAKARKALSIAKKFVRQKHSPLRYVLRGTSLYDPRTIGENAVYRLCRHQLVDPRLLAGALWTFLGDGHRRKPCLWLCGAEDSGVLDLANAVLDCVPLTGVLSGGGADGPPAADLADCAEKMLVWWRGLTAEALRSETVRSLLTGLSVRVSGKTEGGAGKTLSRLPFLITSAGGRDVLSAVERPAELERLRSKIWKFNFPRRVPRALSHVSALEVKDFLYWLFRVGHGDATAASLFETFEFEPIAAAAGATVTETATATTETGMETATAVETTAVGTTTAVETTTVEEAGSVAETAPPPGAEAPEEAPPPPEMEVLETLL